MKVWDAVIVGGGIIGLSLALSLRRSGLQVLVIDRNQPGREASHAAAGMLAAIEVSQALKTLATASAKAYPSFVDLLQDESGIKIDFRHQGTIHFADKAELKELAPSAEVLAFEDVQRLDPNVTYAGTAVVLQENSVDPRSLTAACVAAAKHLEVDISSAAEGTHLDLSGNKVVGVRTGKSFYPAPIVVNCAGAWAGAFGPVNIPVRPIKGQIVCVVPEKYEMQKYEMHDGKSTRPRLLIEHVVRAPGVYVVPRSDGRIVIGSTTEDVGYDKRVEVKTIQGLHQSAANLIPELGQCRILESWAGLRPGTPDKLPILGRTGVEGYFVATGHYRDGILLAPETATQMARLITNNEPDIDLSNFDLRRFEVQRETSLTGA